MASIYPRGDFWWGKYLNCFDVREAISTKERVSGGREAKQRAIEIIADIEVDENRLRHALRLGLMTPAEVRAKRRGSTAIDQVVTMYLNDLPSASWRRKNGYLLKRFVKHADVSTAGELGSLETVTKIESFLRAGREASRSHDWLKKQRSILRRFHRWLWLKGYCRENQADKVERIDGDPDAKVVHRAFMPFEFETLTAVVPELFADVAGAAEAEPVPHLRRLFYALRVWSGLRGEEALRLKRGDLDLSDKPTITVRKEVAKNGLAFIVPIPRSLAETLAGKFGMVHAGVMLFDGMSRWDRTRLAQLRADLKAVGIDDHLLNARSFRMTHETWFRSAGVDDNTIGTLRRDRGEGTKLLRRWKYSDYRQLLPQLRDAVEQADSWYRSEVRPKARKGASA